MNKKRFLPYLAIVASLVVGCNNQESKEKQEDLKNPLLTAYETPFEVPPFDQIKDEHFRPAFKEALSVHNAEVDSILNNAEEASFENTIFLVGYDCMAS